jgi:hypothetical protein
LPKLAGGGFRYVHFPSTLDGGGGDDDDDEEDPSNRALRLQQIQALARRPCPFGRGMNWSSHPIYDIHVLYKLY